MEATRDKKCVERLEILSAQLKSESPQELKEQIDSALQSLLADWKEVGLQISELEASYSRGREIWGEVLGLKGEVEDWLYAVCPQVELGKPGKAVKDRLRQLPLYDHKMNQLQALATELCVTLCPKGDKNNTSAPRLPLTAELEGLSRKLEFLRSYLSSMPTEPSADLLEEARRTFSAASKVSNSELGALLVSKSTDDSCGTQITTVET